MIKNTILASLLASAVSQAAVTLTIQYTADPFTPSPATVTATTVIEDSVLGTSVDYVDFETPPSFILDFEIVVSGASSGNGTFSISQGDIGGFIFQTNGTLPSSADQINLSSFSDLNFFPATGGDPDTPEGVETFLIELGDESIFAAESISAVPEPSSLGLFALAAIGIFTRRARN